MVSINYWLNTLSKNEKKALVRKFYTDAGIGIEGRNVILDNIKVLDKFAELSLKALKSNKHIGSRCIVEVIRFYTAIEDTDKTFKINNNLSKYLARISMELFPELNGYFELRTIK